jgi:acyl carrier protein
MSHAETLDPLRPVPSRARLLAEIAEIAREKVGWTGPVSPELRLVEDLALDSLRLLTLAIEVEDHFRVCLDEMDEEEIETLGDLADTVARKLAAEVAEDGSEELGG